VTIKKTNKRRRAPQRTLPLLQPQGNGDRLTRRYLAPALLCAPFLMLPGSLPLMPVLGQFRLDNMGIAVVVGLLVICLGIHEAAHAWVANRCGDPTAKDLGRITINPIVHIDPVMTIILPFVMYVSTGMMFGGAKPVPVDMRRLRKPLRDMMLVALAGPLSNFVLAVFFAFALVVNERFAIYQPDQMMGDILYATVTVNLLLTAFNMIPIPPLDGSRVMAWLLPSSLRAPYVALERYGMLIVIAFIYFPASRQVLSQSINTLAGVVFWIVDPVVAQLESVVGLIP
jgi:Zn-dependent protease